MATMTMVKVLNAGLARALGAERQGDTGWLYGGSYFSNSFGQPSAYAYVGPAPFFYHGEGRCVPHYQAGAYSGK